MRYLQPLFLPSTGSVPVFPFPSSVAPTRAPRGEIDFAVATDVASGSLNKVILTNLSMAQIVYTQNNSNPDFWESEFQAAFVASLAAYLIPPLNLNMGLLSMQTKIAAEIIETARAVDGNESVVSQNREASWIEARGAGRWIGSGYGSAYSSMSWCGGD